MYLLDVSIRYLKYFCVLFVLFVFLFMLLALLRCYTSIFDGFIFIYICSITCLDWMFQTSEQSIYHCTAPLPLCVESCCCWCGLWVCPPRAPQPALPPPPYAQPPSPCSHQHFFSWIISIWWLFIWLKHNAVVVLGFVYLVYSHMQGC